MKAAWATVISIALCCGIAVAAFTPMPACADSWFPPETWSETSSPCGHFRFTAIPAPHDDYVPEDPEVRPQGVLERRLSEDKWQEVWRIDLVNDIAPTDAIVTDDGDYVVTFDNWYSAGYGENVVVIYGPNGSLVRSMTLTDIIPQTYQDALRSSVSSLDWRVNRMMSPDGEVAFIDVFAPGVSWVDGDPASLRFRIRLNDGVVILPRADKWQSALQHARILTLDRVRYTLEYNRMMRVPLTAPADCDPIAWQSYLEEAIARQLPIGSQYQYVSDYVLRPGDDDEAQRVSNNFSSWASGAARWEAAGRQTAVAAPCAGKELIRSARFIAEQAVAQGEPAPLAMLTLYVAVDRAYFDEVEAILMPSGAKLIWLDPDRAFAQRPDRVPDNDDQVAALEAYESELVAQIAAQ